MNNPTPAAFDIDSLLDGTLDDLADAPEFRPFPVGSYLLSVHLEADKNVKSIYYARLKVEETIELANPEEVPMEKGGETSVRMDLTNEYGQGDFKKIMSAIAAKFGAAPNRALLEQVTLPNNVIFAAVIGQQVNKKNDKVYNTIVEVTVA